MAGMNSMPRREVDRMLRNGVFGRKYAALVSLGVTNGGRVSELLPIVRGDLIDEKSAIREVIRLTKLKSDEHYRDMAIPKRYHKYIAAHLNAEADKGFTKPEDFVFRGHGDKQMRRESVYQFFRNKLGRGYGTHWMRKTFAQLFFAFLCERYPNDHSFTALVLTSKALGHARLETTVKYLNLQTQQIIDTQNQIFN